MSLLQVERIASGYGKKEVIKDITLSVHRGEIVTLIGSNGAGKSTILKTIYGLNEVRNGGKIYFQDENITKVNPETLLQKGMVYIGQKKNSFETLSIEENLKTAAFIYPKRLATAKLTFLYERFPKLYRLRHKKPTELSGGERQLAALAMGLIHEPKLVLFDEPSAGLDVKRMHEIFAIIEQMKDQQSIAFLIVEHRVREIAKITDRWVGLKLGKKVYDAKEIDEAVLKEIFL